jgi:hypothetical protein
MKLDFIFNWGSVGVKVQMFGNDANKSKLHVSKNQEQIKLSEYTP